MRENLKDRGLPTMPDGASESPVRVGGAAVEDPRAAPLIFVRVLETGDEAEARTPEGALLAAHTLGREAKDARGIHGFDPTLTFTVDGQIIRSTTVRALAR